VGLEDGKMATGGRDAAIRIWVGSGTVEQSLKGHTGPVNSLAYNKGQKTLISGSEDCSIRVWRAHSNWACSVNVLKHQMPIRFVDSIGRGHGKIVSGSAESLRVWGSGCEHTELLNGEDGSALCAISLEDGQVASGGTDATVRIWNEGQCKNTLKGHSGKIMSLAVMDGTKLAVASYPRSIRVYGADLKKRIEVSTDPGTYVQCVACMGSGNFAAAVDHSIYLWLADGTRHKVLKKGHTASILCLVNLGRGRMASTSFDETVRVWDSGF